MQGIDIWNHWREENPKAQIDLRLAKLSRMNLDGVKLDYANLWEADLHESSLKEANLVGANLSQAHLDKANLSKAHLHGADLSYARLYETTLDEASLWIAQLDHANISNASVVKVNLSGARLTNSQLSGSNFSESIFSGADLRGANLLGANLRSADFKGANLSGVDLCQADIRFADLTCAILVGAKVDQANISECHVYGVHTWDLEGDFAEQKDLFLTRTWEAPITLDNIQIAEFVNPILHKPGLRNATHAPVFNSILFLGRFSDFDRYLLLQGLKEQVRRIHLSPVVFNLDFAESSALYPKVKTLAGLTLFVIVDVSQCGSDLAQLDAVLPEHPTPVVPIYQKDDSAHAILDAMQTKYPWVMKAVPYSRADDLLQGWRTLILEPAISKRNELRRHLALTPEEF